MSGRSKGGTPGSSTNRGDGFLEPLHLVIAPILESAGAMVGVERLDPALDGRDRAVA